ncbi:MAG TPA: hypothetical protein V6D47_05240 [Oscillatoriaceae cyanobacterium]
MEANLKLRHRTWLTGLMACSLVSACQAHAPITTQATVPSLTIDTASVIHNLATKPNVNFEDATFNMPAVQEARKAHGYRTQATSLPGSQSKKFNLGVVSTSAPCYTYSNVNYYPGPTPNTGDLLYVITDSGTLQVLNPGTMTSVNSRSGLGAFSKSAVVVSSDNNRLYLVTTTGKLLILDTSNLATIATVTLSGTGFAGAVPFIDYSQNTNPNAGEDVYVVAGNGAINKVHTVAQSPHSVTTTLTTWTGLSYGGAITVSDTPVIWDGIAYFGDTAGTMFAVNTGTSSVTSYNLLANTSAQGLAHAISAAPALDFNLSSLTARDLFVPCGDRLNWINLSTGVVTPSASLVLDTIPVAVANTLASFTPITTPKTYTASDWISCAAQNPSPSRWGGASSNPVYNTGITGYTIKFDKYAPGPTTPEIWSGNSNNNTVFPLDLSGTQQGTYSTGGNGYPNELCVDTSGNCWVSMQSGKVVKYSPTGTILATSANIGALWPQTDSAGNCWVTTQGSKVYELNSSGTTIRTITGFSTAFSVITDSSNNAWVTDYSTGKVTKISPTGVTSGPYAVGSRPAYIAIDPTTGNLWTADNGSKTVTEISSTTGAKLAQWTVATGPWCVAFDPSGHLWVSDVSPGNGLEEIDKTTGNVIQTFNMSGFGNAYEMSFDSNGFGWVCTDKGILKISPLGNLEDIFASTYYGTPGDGNDSYGYTLFKWAKNAFTNYPVVGTNLLLTANSTPITPEDLDFFQASAYQGGGSTTLWAGYVGTPNVDYNNRPSVTGPVSTTNNLTVTSGTQYSFGLPDVADQLNTSDGTNARYAYAVQSQGEALQSAAHWYSNLSATNGGQDPTLQVVLDTGAKFPATNGISTQPQVDQTSDRVWVSSCNALFQLDYSSVNNFQSTTKTLYDMTEGGRSNGTTSGPVGSKTFDFPTGNVISDGTHIVTVDVNPSTAQMYVNAFTDPLTDTTDKLGYYWDAAPGTGSVGQQAIYDYTRGSVYLTTSNGYVVRAQILQ